MRLNILTILTISLLLSCTSEIEETKFTTFISNQSSSTVTIRGYNFDNIVFQEDLEPLRNSKKCTYFSEAFIGFGFGRACGFDSLVIKFDNDKGYICAARITNNQSELCLLNGKSPFRYDEIIFKDIGDNTYEFTITEDDFNNALDLPD